MSQENVDSFERGVEAWNSDDFETWIDQFDPEVEWFALMEVYRGRSGAKQAWDSFKRDMELTIRFDDIRDLGESVLALGEMKTTGQTTRLDFTGEVAQLVTYRGGKGVTVRDFRSHADALAAVGLSEQAMSQNVELLLRGYELLNTRFDELKGGELDALTALFDPDVVIQLVDVPDPATYHGHDGVRQWFNDLFGVWKTVRIDAEDFRESGDWTVALLRTHVRGEESGVELEVLTAALHQFRNGLIVRDRVYLDRAEALAAVGLPE